MTKYESKLARYNSAKTSLAVTITRTLLPLLAEQWKTKPDPRVIFQALKSRFTGKSASEIGVALKQLMSFKINSGETIPEAIARFELMRSNYIAIGGRFDNDQSIVQLILDAMPESYRVQISNFRDLLEELSTTTMFTYQHLIRRLSKIYAELNPSVNLLPSTSDVPPSGAAFGAFVKNPWSRFASGWRLWEWSQLGEPWWK